MKITFFSNFLNHHQSPFSIEMEKVLGNNYKFVATEKIPLDRKKLGYEDMNEKYNFVVRAYENKTEAYKLGLESDVVIIGSAPLKFIKARLKRNKLTFIYNERLFKSYANFFKCLPSIIKYKVYLKHNYYLLCASAYSAQDFNRLGLFKSKCYKWGYFPIIMEYKNISNIINSKNNHSIIWVGRFINVKHPELVIELAKYLKINNYNFSINMIGIGPLKEKIEKQIIKEGLTENVALLGSMKPEMVRKYMEDSKIFLFTSDKGEGWGAVLNEAMNSACAVVANNAIGSVPFLIENNTNGLIYEDNILNDFYSKVCLLLDDDKLAKKLGYNAYNTMINEWNPKVAASRFIELSTELLSKKQFNKYNSGPCSKAEIIKDDWYRGKIE